MQDAVNVFHRALKKKDLKINVRYDEMPKCRDNEGSIPLRPGKQVLNKVRAVSFFLHYCYESTTRIELSLMFGT